MQAGTKDERNLYQRGGDDSLCISMKGAELEVCCHTLIVSYSMLLCTLIIFHNGTGLASLSRRPLCGDVTLWVFI